MYYAGTVILNIPDEKFWKMSPKLLFKLMEIHGDVNKGSNDKKQKAPEGYIDQVL